MNITRIKGLTQTQLTVLKALGAIEAKEQYSAHDG